MKKHKRFPRPVARKRKNIHPHQEFYGGDGTTQVDLTGLLIDPAKLVGSPVLAVISAREEDEMNGT